MHIIIRALFGLLLILACAPIVSAAPTSQEILAGILSDQGVSDLAMIDCTQVDPVRAEAYGEAFFTEQIDTNSKEYQALQADFPKDTFREIYKGMGLQNLGCATVDDVASTTPMMMAGTEYPSAQKTTRAIPASIQSQSRNLENMSFIATWTTIVWMFSALGFAVFMIWITSSKFRLQFRRMAEGGKDENSPAMSILKERFARGEITKGEFESMKREISN